MLAQVQFTADVAAREAGADGGSELVAPLEIRRTRRGGHRADPRRRPNRVPRQHERGRWLGAPLVLAVRFELKPEEKDTPGVSNSSHRRKKSPPT